MNILIVDDIPLNLKLLRAQLEGEGYSVVEAMDGCEALTVLDQNPVDAVVSDILMPNMDGYRLCYELRRHPQWNALPFIFYTNTYTSASDEQLSREMGADCFLRKPAATSVILEAMQTILFQRRLTRAIPVVNEATASQARELELMKHYSERLIAKIEEKNQDLQERIRISELSAEMAISFAASSDLSAALNGCAQSIVKQLDAVFARVWALNETTNTLELKASAGLYTHLDGAHSRIKMGEFKIGRIAQQRLPHLTNDVSHDPDVSDPDWARREGMVSFAGYPLIVDNRLIGVVALFSRHLLTNFTLKTLGAIVNQIAVGAERLRAQEALREREEQYRDLLENAGDLIHLITPEGAIVYANPAWTRTLGYTLPELANKTIFDLVPAENRGHCESIFREILDLNQPRHVETVLLSKDGRRVEIEGSATGRFENGRCVVIRCILRDVTEQRSLLERLHRTQRLESLGALASGIAHDLNNVLAPILMATQLLRMKSKDDRDDRMLSTIEDSALRGSDLVKQVLTLARGHKSGSGPVKLEHIIQEMQTIVTQTFPKGISIQVKSTPGTWSVASDPSQLHQVLLNLCVNARDAMPRGGKLTLTTENFYADESFVRSFPTARPGNYVVLKVRDTGTGIPSDIRRRIFEPFFTTKQESQGTGLGLATVATVVNNCGGFIDLDSEVGRGSEFRVYLPASETDPCQADPSATAPLPMGNGELVLVVDDEAALRAMAQQTLEMFGYAVLVARDGAEAVGQLAEHKGEVALLFTDMAMPVMDGSVTIRVARALQPNLKAILTSGLPSEQIPDLESADAPILLSKPYTGEQLLRAVHAVLHAGAPQNPQQKSI